MWILQIMPKLCGYYAHEIFFFKLRVVIFSSCRTNAKEWKCQSFDDDLENNLVEFMRWHSERVFVLPLPGLSQPAQGPHHGGSRHCAPGHGHPHPSCSRTHGGRPPDVNPLDAQNHRGGGTHCPAAGPHTASHRAALQGEQAEKRKTKCTHEKGGKKLSRNGFCVGCLWKPWILLKACQIVYLEF